MNEAFNELAEDLQLQGSDLIFAMYVWNAAQEYYTGDTRIGPCGYFFDGFCNNEDIELTREQKQSLVSLFQKVLRGLEADKQVTRGYVQEAWMNSSKESELGKLQFKFLNKLRDDQRNLKNQYNTLAEIQRKLKRQLSKPI